MKKLLLIVLAMEIAVCGCGNNTPSTTTSTQTTGNWEAFLLGGTDQAALLNFVVAFNVTDSGPLNFTGFTFFNEGACFQTVVDSEKETGNASFTTSNGDTVTGTFNMAVTSTTSANTITLTGTLTGTSNGTTTTTGTLTNGVIVGTWSLTGGAGNPSCSVPQGTFTMCQNPSNGVCPAPTT
jgi:hypothetical protein